MLEGIKGEWTLQRSPQPRALTLSLAHDNFLRLRAEVEERRSLQPLPGEDWLYKISIDGRLRNSCAIKTSTYASGMLQPQ